MSEHRRPHGSVSEVYESEIHHHDAWATATPLKDIMVRESFESPLAFENQFAMKIIGDLKGKRVVDVGTGLGEAAVYFALCGAESIATDISPQMIELTQKLAAFHGTHVKGVVCPCEKLDLPDNSVDVCYSANLMHHAADRDATLKEFHRVLKPGGIVITWDPIAYNPAINIYRRMATKVRTEDEAPLRFSVLKEYARYFQDVRHREFWLTSLMIFFKYYFVDRVHPNQDRYWKRILRETPQTVRWMKPLLAIDRLFLRICPLNYLAWNIMIYGRKP